MADDRNMKRLKDEEQVRMRPAVIFGTNDENGALHGVFEIVFNSIDEAREGFGKEITVRVEPGEIFTITDHGRGLPMDWNPDEQMYNWELALCTLYASGKYDDDQYGQALGLNGLGLTAMQYASSFMEVYSTYGGKTHVIKCKKGKVLYTKDKSDAMQVIEPVMEGTGTIIRFQPDTEVFPALASVTFSKEVIMSELIRQAMLLPGLSITFEHYDLDNPMTFQFDNGAVDYLEALVPKVMVDKTAVFTGSAEGDDKEYTHGITKDDPLYNPYVTNFSLTMNFSRSDEFDGFVEVYHNASLLTERGTSVEGFEAGITRAFNDYARAKGKLTTKENFVYRDISTLLLAVVTSDAPGNRTEFKNQTKKAINNRHIGNAMKQFIYEKVTFWLNNNEANANRVLTEVIANKEAREQADAVSKKVIRRLTQKNTLGNAPEKFVDCVTQVVANRELYIVEGDSALGSVKLARDSKFQAIMPVRGKIINCLKEHITRVLNSDIIIDLFRVLECGMELEGDYLEDIPKFDINKLNYGKILICTDADIDGFHIRTLLITMFYVLAPSIIKSGRLYICDSPLYEIILKIAKNDRRTLFAFTEEEKTQIINKAHELGLKDSQIKINRSKGLGENEPDMMSQTTMNPATRHLIPVEWPADEKGLVEMFNATLGDDIEARKRLVDDYFDTVDINIE